MLVLTALLIGIIAGLRVFTALAAVSWAAQLGWLQLGDTWAAFLGYAWTPWIFSVLAVVEYVTDQLPSTPSRKVPLQLGARLVSGAFCGAAIGTSGGSWIIGLIAGGIGAAIGTYGGAEVRGWLAARFGQDRPAALLEDVAAIVLAAVILGTA